VRGETLINARIHPLHPTVYYSSANRSPFPSFPRSFSRADPRATGRSRELGRQRAAAAAAAARNFEIAIKSCKLTVSNNAPLVEPPQEPLLPARLLNLIAENHNEADVAIILIIYW